MVKIHKLEAMNNKVRLEEMMLGRFACKTLEEPAPPFYSQHQPLLKLQKL